jgi:hypothetical protein
VKRLHLILLISCLPCMPLLAQGGPDSTLCFSFVTPKIKPVGSLYNSIDFLDARRDTSMIGVLGVTDKGGVARLVLATPVLPQLTSMLNALAIAPAGDGRLLLQLKRFSFAEKERARYCYLSAILYVRSDERFTELSSLDTTLIITASFVRGELVKEASAMLGRFLAKSIVLAPAAGTPSFDTADLGRIDSIRKRQIPAYNTSAFTDGFYSNYTAFMDQTPDLRGDVKTKKDGTISSFKIHDANWQDPIRGAHIFGFVYGGTPYIVTHAGFYPLEKRGDDYYFTGELRVVPSNRKKAGMEILGAMAFGATGVLAASQAISDIIRYRVMIDYITGEFIHLEVLP